ncbi:MAG: PAS domain S-box protein, partial [Spirochaetia bacterium]
MESDFYQRVINSLDTPMYVTDTNGTIICINPAFERLTGYGGEDVVGKKTSILKSGEMPDNYYVSLWDSILAGKSWKEEIVNRRKDGNLYTALQSISPIRNENGQIEFFTAVQYDITREKELQDERNIFFNVSVDLFCIVDKTGMFRQVNDAWTQVLGQYSSKLVGEKMLDIVHSEDKTDLSGVLRSSAETEKVMSVDTRILTEEG